MITVTAVYMGDEIAWTEVDENLEYAFEDIRDQLIGTPYPSWGIELIINFEGGITVVKKGI